MTRRKDGPTEVGIKRRNYIGKNMKSAKEGKHTISGENNSIGRKK